MSIITLGLNAPVRFTLTLGLYSDPAVPEQLVTLGLGFPVRFLLTLGLG
jgi:hypothetical protein